MRGSHFGLIAQPAALPVTGSLSRGERAGVRGSHFGLIAQPVALPVTGSLSRGERAGVRGRLATGTTKATRVGRLQGRARHESILTTYDSRFVGSRRRTRS